MTGGEKEEKREKRSEGGSTVGEREARGERGRERERRKQQREMGEEKGKRDRILGTYFPFFKNVVFNIFMS